MKTRMKQLAIVLLALFLFAACNNAKKDKDVIKIGVILPLTGELAEYGISAKEGIDLSISDIKKNNNKTFEVKYQDSKSTTKEAIIGFNYLTMNFKPDIIFTMGSSISHNLIPLINQNKVLTITIAADTSLSGKSKYLFRNMPSSSKQTEKLAEIMVNDFNLNNIAILYINDDYGLSNKEAFSENYTNKGGKIDLVEAFNSDSRDFKGIISKVKSFNGIFIAGYGKTLGLLLKQLRESKFNGKVFTTLEGGYPDVISIAGDAADGIIFPDIPFINNEDNYFVKSYYDEFKKQPAMDAVLSYDVFMLINSLIKDDIIINMDSLRINLLNTKNFKGITGNISILSNGDFDYQIIMKTIKDGKPMIYNRN